ncbi:MAG: hypothetical protein A3F67_07180 [Verrucomicrobia bacterium RIFCSPHIGHO2_12_FULL_41_10]|nr:MAG: hypothetical protein A3F67_07180 [Verrucomicrobia bacterium RIFCSPHIGHO2_12_FULL_41_10]
MTPLVVSPLPSRSYRWRWFLGVLVIIFLLLIGRTISVRMMQNREIHQTTTALAVPSVLVVSPKLGQAEITLRLPGDVNAYADTPIYARTDGYLKRWLVDIGSQVKNGDLLAEIESPEIDQQYNQAVGKLQQAQANLNLAQITAVRWKQLLDRNTVAPQESDQKQGAFEMAKANAAAAQAEVSRLQELKDFEQITAPFDGVITQRNTNVGDLIRVNNMVGQKPLFKIVDDKVFRVYANVPESVASEVRIGQKVTLEFASQPGKLIQGTLVRTADSIDDASRTLLVEIQVLNTDRKLLSGGYATVFIPILIQHPSLLLPVNTLLFRPEGTVVGVVDHNGRVELKKIRIGKDFGNQVEVVEGIKATDKVILNPSDSLQTGDQVFIH